MANTQFRSRLGVKIGLSIAAAVAVLYVSTAAYINYYSEKTGTRTAVRYMETLAKARAASFSSEMSLVVAAARDIASTLTSLDSLPPGERRPFAERYLLTMLKGNPRLYGVWTIWEPDLFDGLDSRFAGKPGEDPTGRFNVRWTMDPANTTMTDNGLAQYEKSNIKVELEIVPTRSVLTDYDSESGGSYYLLAKKSGLEQFLEPYNELIENEPNLMTTFAVPIKNQFGRVLGVVGLDLRLASFVQLFSNEDLYETGYLRFFSARGTVVYDPDFNKTGKTAPELTDVSEEGLLFRLLNHETVSGPFPTTEDPVPEMKSFVPVRIGNSLAPWIVAATVPRAELLREANAQTFRLIVTFVIGALLLLGVVGFQSSSLVKPIKRTARALEDISGGQGDLTRRLAVTSHDEVGKLANDFNAFVAALHEIVSSIRKSGTRLSELGSELSANMDETSAAVIQINSNIESVKQQVLSQAAGVTETSATVQEITRNIDGLSGVIDSQTDSIADSSASVEEMIANVESVTRTLQRNNERFAELQGVSDAGFSRINDVIALVKAIEGQSASLAEANTIVTSIAARTNLLAMNAAIEAAHAGEAGSGFAVVADEIRKLAENAAIQSKTISRELKELKSSIDRVVLSSEEAGKAFSGVRESVASVTEQQRHIHASMEEQSVGNARVLESLGRMKDESGAVNERAAHIREGSRAILEEMGQLVEITQRIRESMDEMSLGTGEINKAIAEVVTLTSENRTGINDVVAEIGRFKTEP